MSNHHKPVISSFDPPHGSLSTYVSGLIGSLLLTGAAYVAATSHGYNRMMGLLVIGLLAAVQAALQLRLFLHLGHEFRPRYKLLSFGFVLMTIIILVYGSIWIMDNLNYRMMYTPRDQTKYLQGQDGL